MAQGEVLAAAKADLEGRVAREDEARNFGEARLLEALADVVDHVGRLSQPNLGEHYRCEKAGELLLHALRVHLRVFDTLAGWPEDGTPAGDGLYDAAELLSGLVSAVRSVMWATAYGRPVTESTALKASDAASEVKAWASTVAAGAVPDDNGEGW